MVSTVFLTVFLDGHVSEMHEEVINLCHIGSVQLVAKSPKAFIIYVCPQRPI